MKISLIIPARNEEASLPRLIESIRSQTRPVDEVVIVDAGSQDRTADILRAAERELTNLKVVRVDQAFPGTARNIGVRAANHEWLAFTDAGIVLEPHWLEELVRAVHSNPDLDVVYGDFAPIVENFVQECAELVYVPPIAITESGRQRHHFIASSLIRRSAFDAAGGFPDYRAAEDRIFMETLEHCGANVGYAARARVKWEIPATLKATFRRFRTLSQHDLVAGRSADWHRRVVAYWVLGTIAFPFAPSAYLWRVVKNMRRRSSTADFDFRRMAMCTAITLTTDIGMFAGILDYLQHGDGRDR